MPWRFALTELATAQGAERSFMAFATALRARLNSTASLAAVDIIPAAYLVKKDGGNGPAPSCAAPWRPMASACSQISRFAYHEVESDAVIFHAVDGLRAAIHARAVAN